MVIPTRNRPQLVHRAVRSALAALPDSCEIVVWDDGSDPPARTALQGLGGPLRVLRAEEALGAARARNRAVAAATGQTVLFLDDDDEMLPDYPARVLRAAAGSALFGFAAVLSCEDGGPERLEIMRYATGRLPTRAPLRHRIGALSAGFWIDRALYLDIGGLPADQTVDEDTALCCALASRGVLPWYETAPGVRVHRGHSAAGSTADQLTRATPGEVVTACYLRTWQRHGDAFPPFSAERWFLATRYVRRALKAGQRAETREMLRGVEPTAFRWGLGVYRALRLLRGAGGRGGIGRRRVS